MREIIFRGKDPENGKWYEGQYIHLHKTTYCFDVDYAANPDNDIHQIVFERMTDWGLPNQHFRADVDPSTVGQYTGLKDKNGKRIFEGDIVDLECDPDLNEFWVVDFGNCGGVENVKHDVGYMGFYLRPLSNNAIRAREYGQRNDPVYYQHSIDLRIIGNVHDNPELIGGAE